MIDTQISVLDNTPGKDYFQWFYDNGIWKRLHYRGIRILKVPSDLWNYQEIFFEHGIEWVIETGTRHGGSALFFADLLLLNNARGRVISIDVDPSSNQVRYHSKINFLYGDSGSSEMAEMVKSLLPIDRGPLFLILDSDHSKSHVLRELNAYLPLLRTGDYLVVEDTCINGPLFKIEWVSTGRCEQIG